MPIPKTRSPQRIPSTTGTTSRLCQTAFLGRLRYSAARSLARRKPTSFPRNSSTRSGRGSRARRLISIRLRPNFTLRAGLRDEFTNGWNEKYGRAAQYLLDANGVPTSDPVTSATHIGSSTFLDNKATRLFSPRVGIAWDVFGNGKTSIRSGFGMFYSLMDNLSFQMNFVAPYNTLFAFNNVSLLDAAVAPPVVPGKALPPFCSPNIPPGVPGAPCTLVQP